MTHPPDSADAQIAEEGGPATNDSRLPHREPALLDDAHDASTVTASSPAPEPPSRTDPFLEWAKYFFGDRSPVVWGLVYLVTILLFLVIVLAFVVILALGLAYVLAPVLGKGLATGVGALTAAAGTSAGGITWWRRHQKRKRGRRP